MDSTSLNIIDCGFSHDVDGPGQRLVIYTKGCNLHCPWCATPESISPGTEVAFYPERVAHSSLLVGCCPYGTITTAADSVTRDISSCATCPTFACTTSGNIAFERIGEVRTVAALVDYAEKYRAFLIAGGVTISGGEACCQFEAVADLLAQLHDAGFHTALETNGTNPRLLELFAQLNLLYIDLKHPDSLAAAGLTATLTAIVLANISARYAQGGDMIVRIPLVPGYNADTATLTRIGAALAAIGPLHVQLLPFHRRGEVKWRAIGQPMQAPATEPTDEQIYEVALILASYGLRIQEKD